MKRIVLKLISIVLMVASAALTSCSKGSNDGSDDTPSPYPDTPHGKVSISHLKSMCRAESQTITDDISIEGYIVVNDLYNEYIKSIVIGDSSGCIEISADDDSTAETFAVGARMVVYCSSLTIGSYGGKILLGAAPSAEYSVGRIAKRDFERYFLIDTSQPKALAPRLKQFDQITTADIGNYIMFKDVEFTGGGSLAWCDTDKESGKYITTERIITNSKGEEFTVSTIAQCSYRDEILPKGKVSLCGIMEYFNGDYSLRVVNHQVVE